MTHLSNYSKNIRKPGMIKKLSLFVLIAFAISSLAFYSGSKVQDKEYGYIGADKCGMCHKKDDKGNQLKVWKESQHAKAFESLKTEEADKIAGGKAVESESCLKCHATGYGSNPELNDKKFSIEEGVSCEACHGSGSEYKSTKVMKVKEDAVANGLRVWANDKEIEKMCLTCHAMENKPENHPKAEFKFAEQYAKIAHPYPEQ